MNQAFLQSANFLINTLFTLYTVMVLLRFLLQWVKADFYNPLCQFLVTLTNPVLLPLRKVIPGIFGIDSASLLLAFVLQLAETSILLWLNGFSIPIVPVIIASILGLVKMFIYIYTIAIIARAIMSWGQNPHTVNPLHMILIQLTEPLLRRVRRFVRPIGGVDLSPLFLLVLMQIVLIFIGHS